MYLTTTDKMPADIFTKSLSKTAFLHCRSYLVTSPSEQSTGE